MRAGLHTGLLIIASISSVYVLLMYKKRNYNVLARCNLFIVRDVLSIFKKNQRELRPA